MYKEFAVINHIDDVLPYIDDNFIVAKKDGYTIINYILSDKETFPEEDSHYARVRIECRGITFDNETGLIIRRPYQKFFNLGERENLSLNMLSGKDTAQIFEKIDGSMVAYFETKDGRRIFGSKMVDQFVTNDVRKFVDDNIKFEQFAHEVFESGYTPIFEWTSPKNRIVLDYGSEPNLILVAIRNMITGEYLDIHL